jgi:feruloyl esterase
MRKTNASNAASIVAPQMTLDFSPSNRMRQHRWPLRTPVLLKFLLPQGPSMGTSPATALDGRALTGHLEKQIDFAYRSTHLMNVLAKQLIADFYSQDPEYSYYYGCSTGGGQGMHIVEQYPDDYDGVVAGAPAINRTHSGTFWNFFVTHESPDSVIPEDKATLVTDAVLTACATKKRRPGNR